MLQHDEAWKPMSKSWKAVKVSLLFCVGKWGGKEKKKRYQLKKKKAALFAQRKGKRSVDQLDGPSPFSLPQHYRLRRTNYLASLPHLTPLANHCLKLKPVFHYVYFVLLRSPMCDEKEKKKERLRMKEGCDIKAKEKKKKKTESVVRVCHDAKHLR